MTSGGVSLGCGTETSRWVKERTTNQGIQVFESILERETMTYDTREN